LKKTETNHNSENRWKLYEALHSVEWKDNAYVRGICLRNLLDESVWLHADVFRELEVQRKSQITDKNR